MLPSELSLHVPPPPIFSTSPRDTSRSSNSPFTNSPSHLNLVSSHQYPITHIRPSPRVVQQHAFVQPDLPPHSVQLQLSIERSFMQQLNSDNRILNDRVAQMESKIASLQEQLQLSEKSKIQFKTQLYANRITVAALENKVRNAQQLHSSGASEFKHLKEQFRSAELDLEKTVSQLKSRVKELESILEATKTQQLRDKYNHEMKCERLKAQVDMEKHKSVSFMRKSVEAALDASIHEDNKSTIAQKDKMIKQLQAKLRLLESENADLQEQIASLTLQHKKSKSKLKTLEKKVIPSLKQEMERQSKYIGLIQKERSTTSTDQSDNLMRDLKAGNKSTTRRSSNLIPFQEKANDDVQLPKLHADSSVTSHLSIDSMLQDFEQFKGNVDATKAKPSSTTSSSTPSPQKTRSDVQQRFKDVQRYIKQEEDMAKMDTGEVK